MFTLFESKKHRAVKGQLSNLAAVAKADGKISKPELEALFHVGQRNGLSKGEVKQVIAKNEPAKVDYNASFDEKLDYLYELVSMMLADGDVDGKEMDYCLAMANKFGFRPAIVGVLVRQISTGVKQGWSKDEVKRKVASFA